MKKLPESKDNMKEVPADSSVTMQSAVHTWWEQLLYLLDSMRGKYSFDTYLEVMNDFIDEEIRNMQAQGLRYTGGHVVFEDRNDDCDIQVELFFLHPQSNQYSVKRAKRQLPKKKFVRRDIELLEKQEKLEFNVEKPED